MHNSAVLMFIWNLGWRQPRNYCSNARKVKVVQYAIMIWMRRSRAKPKYGLTWKDDYLLFCIYVRAGTMQRFASTLGGIEVGRMSNTFHEWTHVLDDALQEMCPRPTCSQMLQAYPSRFIETDGHARCYLLLEAFEVFTQSLYSYNVASSTHSDYKKHCIVKFWVLLIQLDAHGKIPCQRETQVGPVKRW